MKTIGLLGGMSWESTIPYYRHINEAVKAALGGLHSAKLLLYSVDFQEIDALQQAGKWDEAGHLLASAAKRLETAGAQCIVLCANTMHLVAPAIEAAISIPFLHIADAAAIAVKQRGLHCVGLLGTRFTMEQDFYLRRLREKHGLEVFVPEADDRAEVHRIIYQELCLGRILGQSRVTYEQIIERLTSRGAQGIILGCTEIPMLIDPARLAVPAFDTALLHAQFAANYALSEPPEPAPSHEIIDLRRS